MAQHDQKIDSILDNTLQMLSGGAPATSPDEGVNLIQDWIGVVRSDVSTQWVAEPLEKLRDALNNNDMRTVERVMRDLAGATIDLGNNAADGAYKQQLQNLSTALNDFARGLYGAGSVQSGNQ
ncbi:hypothetical protein HNV11_19760 [Spirosoma taeanense]|uniref:Uncharacterized protein n=1 Tax=Spirosoma taeanense TaxID=2735870 RepID=A0A6M5YCZ6_9BACT|nr:hypothetical protein [Spirosoma taeanense]QJW91454.1 hypothetical protein HNV11_19760 [Spirosoma taeanense]